MPLNRDEIPADPAYRSNTDDDRDLTAHDDHDGPRDTSEWAPPASEGGGSFEILDVVTDFVEDQLRVRPIPTLLAAVVAGWLAGKLLR